MNRILLIEDDHELSELLCFHFRDEGYQVRAIHNGKRGYEIALQEQFWVVS